MGPNLTSYDLIYLVRIHEYLFSFVRYYLGVSRMFCGPYNTIETKTSYDLIYCFEFSYVYFDTILFRSKSDVSRSLKCNRD